MTEEQRKQPATLSREELYRQVWETPTSRLCAQYGISGRGLKKICDRLSIPCPPRGYWARLAAGQRVKQIPLPDAAPGVLPQVTITPTPPTSLAPGAPELHPDTAERLRTARAEAVGIAVPATLRRPHPAIAAWIARHEIGIAADHRDRLGWGHGLRTKPFTPLERRQQRILNTLFKEAEKLGCKISGEAPHQISIESGRNKIEFTLREWIKQFRRPLSDEEKADRYFSGQRWRQESIATGELIFNLKTFVEHGLRREWRDGERRLEEQVDEIVAVLAVAGPILERRRLEEEAAERRRWEEEKRRHEEKERLDKDHNRWRRFVQFAKLWEEMRLAENFLDALEKQPVESEVTCGEWTPVEWMTWARERQQAFDPSRWNEIWKDIASITAWETSRPLYTVRMED
jgi:hypothetical protein